ncbi:MAG: molybdopterin converting factor subunit 1 [Azospirillaceae bacterium]
MRILYFAWVRDRIGLAEERIALPEGVATVGALKDWLIARGGGYAAALDTGRAVRFAVNQRFAKEGDAIAEGDEIAVFPPVTGG